MGAKLIGIGGGPNVDPYVAALGPSQFLQSLTEGCDASLTFRIVRRYVHKYSDPPHALALLRARRERPRGHSTAEHGYESAPVHSITSSARASSVAGTSRPSALAVLRLRIVSYLVGASTGRSVGFSPFRTRST